MLAVQKIEKIPPDAAAVKFDCDVLNRS